MFKRTLFVFNRMKVDRMVVFFHCINFVSNWIRIERRRCCPLSFCRLWRYRSIVVNLPRCNREDRIETTPCGWVKMALNLCWQERKNSVSNSIFCLALKTNKLRFYGPKNFRLLKIRFSYFWTTTKCSVSEQK